MNWSDKELDETIAYWQPRYGDQVKLTREDAREINQNLVNFAECLLDIDRSLRARGIDVLKDPPRKWRLEHGEFKGAGPDGFLMRRYITTNGYAIEFTAVGAKKVVSSKTRWRVTVYRAGSVVDGGSGVWIVRTPEIEGIVDEVASRTSATT